MSYAFEWAPIWDARALILSGLEMTVALSAASLALATVIGVAVGAFAAGGPVGRGVSNAYVELMRNVPLLIHMYFWYMGLSFLKLPPFLCAVFGLSIYSAAYVAEIVRGGVDAVPRGQRMAALASGLTPLQSLRLVVLPQALRVAAPSLASLFSQLIKDSSLASVIAVAELTYQANAIEAKTFRTFEVYITISLLYLALVLAVTGLVAGPWARRSAPAGLQHA